MKTLVLYLAMVAMAATAHSQKITELNEANVGFAPLSSEVVRDGDKFSYKVNESYAGEFEKDPLAFMENYFNVDNFILEVQGEKYDSYFVTFTSSKGSIKVDFNDEGELIKSSSRFKNILLPRELRKQLYKDHQGWEMLNNTRITESKDGIISKDIYKVKLKSGKNKKSIVLDSPLEGTKVVSN